MKRGQIIHPDWCERRRLCQVNRDGRGYHVGDSMTFSDSDEWVELAIVAWHEVSKGEQVVGLQRVRVRTVAGGVDEFCDAVISLETAKELSADLDRMISYCWPTINRGAS